jgi:acetylornithine deacetylase/succinyl-diaminopimelate desuccinylase-like protein
MKKHFIILLLILSCIQKEIAQVSPLSKIRDYGIQHAGVRLNEFMEFLSIPNIAADTQNMKKNASFIINMMKQRGIGNIQELVAKSSGVPPVIYGEVLVPGATKTLIFYAHYDGQPVNPAQWAPGLEPFSPKLYDHPLDHHGSPIPIPADGVYNKDWRIYARGASDDKAGVVTILNAYDAINKSELLPSSNLKFFFEGEEEAGSPHLYEILEKYGALLQSDLWIICDGPIHQSGKKQIVFGVRGRHASRSHGVWIEKAIA